MKRSLLIVIFLFSACFVYSEELVLNGVKMQITNLEKADILQYGVLEKEIVLDIDKSKVTLKENMRIVFDPLYKYITMAYVSTNHKGKVKIGSYSYSLLPGSLIRFGRTYDGYFYIKGISIATTMEIKQNKRVFTLAAEENAFDCGIYFSEQGDIQSVILRKNHRIKIGERSLLFSDSSRMNFNPDGTIKEGVLAPAQSVVIDQVEINVKGGMLKYPTIGFYKSGKIQFLIPNQSFDIQVAGQTVQVMDSKKVGFYDNDEKLAFATLNSDAELKYEESTRNVEAGTTVYFDENGVVTLIDDNW